VTGLEKISGSTPSRKSLLTGSPIMTALKIGSPSKNENASRVLTMYQSLFVAQPNSIAGPRPHHSKALPANRMASA